RSSDLVFARSCRVQNGPRSTPAPTVLLRHLEKPETGLLGTVENVVAGIAKLFARLDKQRRERVDIADPGNIQRATNAMPTIRRIMLIVLVRIEDRSNAFPVPARCPFGSPVVIILMLATDVDHGIDRAAAPQSLATRPVELSVAEMLLLRGIVTPVALAFLDQADYSERHVNETTVVMGACLDQADTIAATLAEPISEHTARRTGTDNDEIILAHQQLPPLR